MQFIARRTLAGTLAVIGVVVIAPLLRGGEASSSRSFGTVRLSSAAFVAGAQMRDRLRRAEQEISRALQAEVSVDFRREPLQRALQQLAGDIPLHIDRTALHEKGIALHARVDSRLRNVTIDTALRRILHPLDLTFIIEQEGLFVTSDWEAGERLRLSTFDVGPLLDQARRLNRRLSLRDRARMSDGLNAENEWLYTAVEECTSGEWEHIDGVGGTAMIVGDKLLVRQTYAVLEEIGGVLEALHEAASGRLRYGSTMIYPAGYPREADERIFRALTRSVGARYADRPLGQALAELGDRLGIPIWIDRIAWAEEGLSADEPVSIDRQNVALHSLLRGMLEPLGLAWYVDRGMLVVTTETEAGELLRGAIYDFRDLYAGGVDGTVLIDAAYSFTSGEWEEIDGVGGTAEMPFPGILLVRQTDRVLDEIDGLLADLRHRAPAAPPLRSLRPFPRGRGSSASSSSSSSSSSSAGRVGRSFSAALRPDPPIDPEPGASNSGDQPPGADVGTGFFSTVP